MDHGPLRPGDVLLYRTSGLFGLVIRLKTWSPVSHVETYVGFGHSVASRDGIGVGMYDVRRDHLAYVLRPTAPFNLEAALKWQEKVAGARYDWLGVVRSFADPYEGGVKGRYWCSEHAAIFANKGGIRPFGHFRPDKIAPANFLMSPAYCVITDHLKRHHVLDVVGGAKEGR